MTYTIMPYARRKYRKKGGNRKRSYRKKAIIRKSPVPLKFPTKLRYVENFTIDPPAAGLTGNYVFSANGLHDPNITGVGHQPRGYDQIGAMYDHYTVIGSKATVTLTMNSVGTINQVCGLAVLDTKTAYSDPNDYMESGTVRSGHINHERATRTFSLGYSPKRFLGKSKPLSDNSLKGTTPAGATPSNPSEQVYYHLFSAGLNGTNPSQMDCTMVIDYIVVFTEPIVPGQS